MKEGFFYLQLQMGHSSFSSRKHTYIILTTRPPPPPLLKSHFYIAKLGFKGVYIIFLISAQNIECGYSLEPPQRGGSNEYNSICLSGNMNKTKQKKKKKKKKKKQNFYLKTFSFWWGNFQNIWKSLFSYFTIQYTNKSRCRKISTCAIQRFRSACSFVQSGHNIHYADFG